MLSKFDIFKELGNGICVYPLILDNIKENSINLCAGEFAWTTISSDIYVDEKEYDKNKRFSLQPDNTHNKKVSLEKGHSAILDDSKNSKYILMLPLSTTLIETQEVLSVSSYIGGTYHSKVGIVSKGIGHIGTMVGPNFSGDSLIAFHNTSQNLIVIKTGDSFVSVVFHYLNTPYTYINPTTSGHTDKFSELGLYVSEEQSGILNQDWKKNFNEVNKKMCHSAAYEELQKNLKEQKNKKLKNFFCKKNIMVLLVTIISMSSLYIIAYYIDKNNNNSIWTDRYFSVGCSGIFIVILSGIFKYLKSNTK